MSTALPATGAGIRQRNTSILSPETKSAGSDVDNDSSNDLDSPKQQQKKTATQLLKEEDAPPSGRGILLEVLRTLVFVLVASTSLSYLITRESFVWNIKRPAFTRPEAIKAYFKGPIYMTDLEIAQFSGEDETKPIYLAINGTIYDVSVGARHYGPKGSYHIFAGREASRAFISSCFETDSIPDMRGVEQQFLPLDDPQIDAEIESNIGADGMRMLRAEELRRAKQEAFDKLDHWVKFFANSGKYPEIGKMKRDKAWEASLGPVPKLCEKAAKGRKKRDPKPKGSV